MHRSADPDWLGFVLADAARPLRAAVEKAIDGAGFDVTPAEARSLTHRSVLEAARQPIVAERIGIEPMTLSGHLERLASQGLLRRHTDPRDRRARIVRLTDKDESPVVAIRSVTAGSSPT